MADLLRALSPFKHITIVCHPNADPDCLGAAHAISFFIKVSLRDASATIYVPESINTASSRLIEFLKIELSTKIDPQTDMFVLVDTSSLDQVPSVKSWVTCKGTPYILLDHHVSDPQTTNKAMLAIVREASSVCEIVYEILHNMPLTQDVLEALLVGIIYDSRRFLIQPDTSIITASKLIERGAKADQALKILSPEEDSSEKMAKLKGSARTRLFKVSSWIIAITHVGAFEASVARALTDLGADLALVINQSTEALRLTGRSQEIFYNQTGLNLASDLMQPLAKELSGQGGGHPTAASATLNVSAESLLPRLLDILAERLQVSRESIVEIDTKK